MEIIPEMKQVLSEVREQHPEFSELPDEILVRMVIEALSLCETEEFCKKHKKGICRCGGCEGHN